MKYRQAGESCSRWLDGRCKHLSLFLKKKKHDHISRSPFSVSAQVAWWHRSLPAATKMRVGAWVGRIWLLSSIFSGPMYCSTSPFDSTKSQQQQLRAVPFALREPRTKCVEMQSRQWSSSSDILALTFALPIQFNSLHVGQLMSGTGSYVHVLVFYILAGTPIYLDIMDSIEYRAIISESPLLVAMSCVSILYLFSHLHPSTPNPTMSVRSRGFKTCFGYRFCIFCAQEEKKGLHK